MKIYSWNVNGIRAVVRKGEFQKFITEHDPDILCLQETKAEQGQAVIDLPQYEEYWNSSKAKKGYSGTAIFTKIKPIAIINDIPEKFVKEGGLVLDNYGHSNDEGRVIAAEFDDFYVVTAYTPNAKDDLTRIPLRQQWDQAMIAYCKALESGAFRLYREQGAVEEQTETYKEYDEGARQAATQQPAKNNGSTSGSARRQAGVAKSSGGKPVIYCGDMNVAHTEDDLANPGPNKGKKGFTEEERTGFDRWLAAGFVDTFRMFKQGKGYYTWWSHFANSRARNVGWRIDYFLVSESLKNKIKTAEIHPKQMGSDHCPISIEIVL